MTSFSRESWQDPANPITGPKPKAKRTTGVVHYSGSNSIPGDKPAWLRSMQNDYTRNRGYSLGYGYLVTGNGDDYEIRGADFNMASNNGDKVSGNANDWTLSILLDVTVTSPATPTQIATCQRIFAQAGITTRPVPHSFYDYTACCGDTVRGQIDAGLFDPTSKPDPIPPKPTPIPPEDDMSNVLILEDARTGAWYRCGDDSKSWIRDGNMAAQINMRLAETQQDGVALDGFRYVKVTNGNVDFIRSTGPIIGPAPDGVDEYGG